MMLTMTMTMTMTVMMMAMMMVMMMVMIATTGGQTGWGNPRKSFKTVQKAKQAGILRLTARRQHQELGLGVQGPECPKQRSHVATFKI